MKIARINSNFEQRQFTKRIGVPLDKANNNISANPVALYFSVRSSSFNSVVAKVLVLLSITVFSNVVFAQAGEDPLIPKPNLMWLSDDVNESR